ncbi:MAG TPA: hypothetical protein VG942_06250 [Hyphomonadaceae bacterium]|nr:hypothetical protein [Hyphomonadaceae bacterium]
MSGVSGGYLWSASRVAILTAMALSAVTAAAQVKSGAAWNGGKDCIVRDVGLPDAGRLGEMARTCDATAVDLNAKGGDQAIAAYNGARAHLAQATANGISEYVTAASAISRSMNQFSNDHPELTRPAKPNDKKDAAVVLANQRFRYGRVYDLARAYIGLAQADPPVTAQSAGGVCVGKVGCYSEAIRQLEITDVARPFASDPTDTRYDEFVSLRANSYLARGLATDPGKARVDFEELVRRETMPGRSTLAASAKTELAKIYAADGQAALATGNLSIAIDSFQKAAGVDPNALDPRMGLGRANLALADSSATGKNESYIAAAGAFELAARMAAERQLQKDEAAAHEGRAQALLGQATLADAAGTDSSSLLQQAITELTSASRLEPKNAERQLKLARALNRAHQSAQADQVYEAAVALLPQGPSLSDALLELAEVKAALPTSKPETVRQTYERARSANPQSSRPGFEIGLSYYKQGLLTQATSEFQGVIDKTGGLNGSPPPGELQYKADAYYYLSLIDAQKAGASPLSATAVSNAERAVQVGAPNPPRNYACLAHIMRGGKSVTGDGMSTWCSGSDGKPEGLLLRGMFYLRQAQIADASAKLILRDSAQFAFNQGANEAKRLVAAAPPGDPVHGNDITFTWPGAPKPANVQVLLEYGKAVVVGCGLNTALVPLSDADRAAGEVFFKFYRVFDCEAPRQ